MKEKFGYTEDEIKTILTAIEPYLKTAIRLNKPIEKTRTWNGDSHKWDYHFTYFSCPEPIAIEISPTHKMTFTTIDGMFRIFWRLTNNKYAGTNDLKYLYYEKFPEVDNNIPFINGGRCSYSPEVSAWMADKLDINTNEIKPEGCLLLEDVIE